MRKLVLITIFMFTSAWVGTAFAQDNEVRFSHQLHVVEQEIECLDCHESAAESVSGMDNHLPDMETCANCHDVEDDENCKMCHSNLDEPSAVTRVEEYSKKFPHKTHLEAGLECANCHEAVKAKTTVDPKILPTMVECVACHNSRSVSVECLTCHTGDDPLKPASHNPGFLHAHSDLARNQVDDVNGGKNCTTCHRQFFCQECHEGDNLDRRTHPLDFQTTHSLQARGKERDCAVCHTDRNFCADCHREFNLMPQDHTPGWTNVIPGDGGRHRLAASTDLESCLSCHEANAQEICSPCHQNRVED